VRIGVGFSIITKKYCRLAQSTNGISEAPLCVEVKAFVLWGAGAAVAGAMLPPPCLGRNKKSIIYLIINYQERRIRLLYSIVDDENVADLKIERPAALSFDLE